MQGCQMAKLYPFLSLDCAPTPSTLAQSKERKGSNFAIWQPCITYLFVRVDPDGCPGGALWHLDEGADDVSGAEEDAGALEARAGDHLDRLRLDDGDRNLEHVALVGLGKNSTYVHVQGDNFGVKPISQQCN